MRQLTMLVLLISFTRVCFAADAPSLGAAQSDYSAGQYRSALQKIASALSGPAARPGSPARYDLFMLRGECLLQLKSGNLAADAFDAASRSVKGEGDIKRVSEARADALLVKASTDLAYKPAGAAEPIGISAPESRQKATAAFLKDRLAAVKPRAAAAMEAPNLVPLHELMPALADAYMIEFAATGDTKETTPIAKSLGAHARELIDAELERYIQRADDLYALACQPSFDDGGRSESIGYRGLTSSERDELHTMAAELTKIKKLSQEGRRINRRLGGTGEVWDAVLAKCDDCEERADRAYSRKY